jgi:hypothetical protein
MMLFVSGVIVIELVLNAIFCCDVHDAGLPYAFWSQITSNATIKRMMKSKKQKKLLRKADTN